MTAKRCILGSYLLVCLSFGLFLLDKHALRASLIYTHEVSPEVLKLPPDEMPIPLLLESSKHLERFRQMLPDYAMQDKISLLSELLAYYGELYNPTDRYLSTASVPEYPDLILERRKEAFRGSCYNDAILFSAFTNKCSAFISNTLGVEGAACLCCFKIRSR